MNVRLSDILRAFQGILPSIIATSDSRGVPNVTYVSQVYFVDDADVVTVVRLMVRQLTDRAEQAGVPAPRLRGL